MELFFWVFKRFIRFCIQSHSYIIWTITWYKNHKIKILCLTTITRQNFQNNKEVNYQTSQISFKNTLSKWMKKRKVLNLNFCYILKRVLLKWPAVLYTQPFWQTETFSSHVAMETNIIWAMDALDLEKL